MANQIIEYTVFISCPSDMQKEKEAVTNTIERLNRFYDKGNTKKVRIKSLTFDDITPKTDGVKKAQSIINSQIDRKYDIYIGIMGARFGRPTTKYGSGTQEEFINAVDAQKRGDVKEIAFYFKDNPINNRNNASEIEQLLAVVKFKESIDGLYKDFNSDENLVNSVEHLLSDFLNKASNELKEKPQQMSMIAEIPSRDVFVINKRFFNDILNYPDASISNGYKAHLSLDDIYVYPDLRVLTEQVDEEGNILCEQNINSEELFNNTRHALITGEEKSGKTALCRKIFLEYHHNGFVPVLITGKDIKNNHQDSFSKNVRILFQEQYSKSALKRYDTLEKQKKVLIIDDYHLSSLNTKAKLSLLSAINESYGAILIFTDYLFIIDSTTTCSKELGCLSYFMRYKIRDFGQRLRLKIIEKWYKIGREDQVPEDTFHRDVEVARNTVDAVIGNSLVPSCPFIILVLLQAIESKSYQSLTDSSFVRYYKFLIDKCLLENINKNDVDLYYAFLPEFAYHMFSLENKVIGKDEFEKIIKAFQKKKALDNKVTDNIKATLIQSEILRKTEQGSYSFKHIYSYFYFLGIYLSSNINDKEISGKIDELCKHLYLKENADIIIFLCYHSNNQRVLDNILSIANSLFPDVPEFSFDSKGVSILNQLQEAYNIILDPENASNIKESILAKRDHIEDKYDSKNEFLSKEDYEDINDLNFSTRLNISFKVIQIMGQILKNHYAKLDASPKKEMCETVYYLGFRCLNYVITQFSNDIPNLKEAMKNIDPDIKTEKDAHRAVFQFAAFIVYAFSKLIGNAVGAEKLSETFKQILHANNNNSKFLTISLVNTSIKLDFFEDFPIEEIERLTNNSSLELKHPLAFNVLRKLILSRLYMRPLSEYKLRHKVCSIAKIDVKRQLTIENKSDKKSA
jgi:hypothetical protein